MTFKTNLWGLSFFCLKKGVPEIGITYIEVNSKIPALSLKVIRQALDEVQEQRGLDAVPVAVFPIYPEGE